MDRMTSLLFKNIIMRIQFDNKWQQTYYLGSGKWNISILRKAP